MAANAPSPDATAAYVRLHRLDVITNCLAEVVRDAEDDQTRKRGTASSSGGRGATGPSATSETTLLLQLLHASLTAPASSTGGSGSSGAASKASAKAAPAPPTAPTTSTTTGGESGAGHAAVSSPCSPLESAWPAEAAFATREAALKAEVCRCLALRCARALTGVGLVDTHGGHLRWCDVAPHNERLGVALFLDAFACWRLVVAPLLLRLSLGASSKPHAADAKDVADSSEGADRLFRCLVAGPATGCSDGAGTAASAGAYDVASYWCFAVLRGFCQDFPEGVWASVLRIAQAAAVADARDAAGGAVPLDSETLLLRSCLAHLPCALRTGTAQPAGALPSAAAVAAARSSAAPWVWAEVEALHQASEQPDVRDSADAALSALLRADAYWAAFTEPYTFMLAQHFA